MGLNRRIIEGVLTRAGITVNGPEEYDIHIKNQKFYTRVLRDGSVGFGESYVEGWWECNALDEFFYRLFSMSAEKEFSSHFHFKLQLLKARFLNL